MQYFWRKFAFNRTDESAITDWFSSKQILFKMKRLVKLQSELFAGCDGADAKQTHFLGFLAIQRNLTETFFRFCFFFHQPKQYCRLCVYVWPGWVDTQFNVNVSFVRRHDIHVPLFNNLIPNFYWIQYGCDG